MKKAAILFLKVAIPAAIFAYLLWRVDPQQYQAFWDQPKRWDLLVLAQGLATAAIVIGILRWRMLVEAFEISFSIPSALRIGFLGYLLNSVSLGSVGGDVFKAVLVARSNPRHRPEAVASVLLDRAIGLLGLIIVASVCLLMFASSDLPTVFVVMRDWATGLMVASIAALILAIYSGAWFDRLIDWGATWPWVGPVLARMARAVRLLRKRPLTLVSLVLQSVVVHSLLATTVYLVSCGAYPEHPSVIDHFTVVPPALAAGAIPLAPGGLGYQEAALANLFELLPGVPERFSGMLVATLFRVVMILIAGIGLVIYWLTPHQEMESVRSEANTLD